MIGLGILVTTRTRQTENSDALKHMQTKHCITHLRQRNTTSGQLLDQMNGCLQLNMFNWIFCHNFHKRYNYTDVKSCTECGDKLYDTLRLFHEPGVEPMVVCAVATH